MLRALVGVVLVAGALAGCQTSQADQTIWISPDGSRGRDNPAAAAKFQRDKLICEGEMAKVAGGADPVYFRGIGGLLMASAVLDQRQEMYRRVGVGCMIERGWVMSTASRAEADAAALRKGRRG